MLAFPVQYLCSIRGMLGSADITLRAANSMRMRTLPLARAQALFLPFLLAALDTFAAPVLSSFVPPVGKPGTQVVINGSGFSTATLVTFDTTVADFSVT